MKYIHLILLLLGLQLQATAQKFATAYAQGNYEKAIKFAEKTIDEEPKNLEAYMVKAMSNLHLGSDSATKAEHTFGVESALGTLKLIIKKDKTGDFINAHLNELDSIVAANYLLAEKNINKGKTEKASKILNDLIKIKPIPAYYYQVGIIYLNEGNILTAIDMFNDAAAKIYLDSKAGIQPDPYLDEIFVTLAGNIADKGDLNSAYTIYNRALIIFNNTSINDAYKTFLEGLILQLNGYNDSSRQIAFIQNLDTAAQLTKTPELFTEIKWEMIMQYFDYQMEYDYYDAAELVESYVCAEKKTEIAEIYYAKIFESTFIKSTVDGTVLYDGRQFMRTWLNMQSCLNNKPNSNNERMYAVMDSLLVEKKCVEAYKWLHNIKLWNSDTKKVASYEYQIYNIIKVEDTSNFSFSNLYDLTYFFPANKNFKSLQEKGAYAEIIRLIGQKKFSESGKILRAQITLNPNDIVVNDLYRRWVILDFNENFLGSSVYINDEDWGGSVEQCEPGKLSAEMQAEFLQRLNYFRRAAGVPDNCELRTSLNEKCQAAALMMTANYDLSHSPPADWKCYTTAGAVGAGNSNLSLGYSGVSALLGQLEDDGDNNYFVGHRRWILNPNRKVFGHGSTDNAMALWALGGENSNFNEIETKQFETQYICWPPEHYFPSVLYAARWSFSLRSADFSNATVEMYQEGKKLDVIVLENNPGYGMNTLVWEPQGVRYYEEIDFKVVIKNVGIYQWDEAKSEYITIPKTYTYSSTMLELR